MTFLDELSWRGLLHQTAGDGVEDHLAQPPRVGYAGFDPTTDSLTIGNYIPIKMLMHWQRAGHKPIVVMGGGTGLIGDPSGKDAERQLQTRDEVIAKIEAQRPVFEHLLDFSDAPNGAVLLNNLDWLEELSFIDVLRDVGKHFSVNVMIQKDSVRDRLENREQGISYTEFSYMILQAYDFLHLRRSMNCTCQIAGSDQYGNIVAGMDLIRREFGAENANAYAITNPLVTRSDGRKIGKTEEGAIFLTAHRTSPYKFYQYWINVEDRDVIKFLKWFTFIEREEIEALERRHDQAPHERAAHRALANHMTALIHGDDVLRAVEHASEALFNGDVRSLDAAMLAEVFADVPHSMHDRTQLSGGGIALLEVLAQSSLASSKREARDFLSNGAVSINGERVDLDRSLTKDDLLPGNTILIRRGKKHWHATKWD